MLTHIHIQNFAIVESMALDFYNGLNVLTGETGAGKSLWIDATQLALGARAESSLIRHSTDRCTITLCFDVNHLTAAKNWLTQHDFDAKEECIISRVIYRNQPSRSTINGTPCPQHLVRELAPLLIHIQSQNEQQSLLQWESIQNHLDTYANNDTYLKPIREYYEQWHTLALEITDLQNQMPDRDTKLDFLQYQLAELEALNLTAQEWENLFQEHQKLYHSRQLVEQINQALDLTVETDQASAHYLIQQALNQLATIKIDDPQINTIRELLDTAIIHVQEAGNELNHYRNHLDLSPERLAYIEQRLSHIHDIARKHHINPQDLLELQASLTNQINTLNHIEQKIEALQQQQALIITHYQTLANQLSQHRKKMAKALEQQLTQTIQALGIMGGRAQVALQPIEQPISSYGQERVQLLVSTNPGLPFSPLHKVASGGELSRIHLAFQLIIANKRTTPTLIFDEIDVGIGGKTADKVGDSLRALGAQAQILCITHLAQVAAKGHHHYVAHKTVSDKIAETHLTLLDEAARIQELARMLGGADITEQALNHARNLLETAVAP